MNRYIISCISHDMAKIEVRTSKHQCMRELTRFQDKYGFGTNSRTACSAWAKAEKYPTPCTSPSVFAKGISVG